MAESDVERLLDDQSDGNDASPLSADYLQQIKSTMTDMLSSLKTELFAHVDESLAQMYVELEQPYNGGEVSSEDGASADLNGDLLANKIDTFTRDKTAHQLFFGGN